VLISKILTIPRYQKRIVSLVADSLFLPFALWLAFSLRLDEPYFPDERAVLAIMMITVLATILIFIR